MNAADWGRVQLLVALLLVFQLVTVVLMWSLNPIGQVSQGSFALLLAADLLAFSMVSYVARIRNLERNLRGYLILVGSAAVLLVMFLALLE